MKEPNYKEIIDRLYQKHAGVQEGALPIYIPQLTRVDPDLFSIAITLTDGTTFTAGDSTTPFTLQSISKPFVFASALQKYGNDRVRSRVGVEPSGEVFHSTIKLDNESRRPYNPFMNTGAIAMTDLVEGSGSEERFNNLKQEIEKFTNRTLEFNSSVYLSEKDTGHRNRAIAYLMRHFGMISERVEESLDLYFRQCAIEINCEDLSMMAAVLANYGVHPKTKKRVLSVENVERVLTIMFTCGLYTYAGEWAYSVGLPAKSGVSGGILVVSPGRMGFATYSPLLDHHGNSIRGVLVGRDLSDELGLHVFRKKTYATRSPTQV